MRKHTCTREVWGHASPEKLGALRSLLRPYLYSNLYLDTMPLEYQARVFLECHSPCSGITEPSLHMFQQQGMVKKVTIPDSLQGGEGGTKRQILTKGGHSPLVPPWCPPGSATYGMVVFHISLQLKFEAFFVISMKNL